MPDPQPPLSPFALTPQRVMILVIAALAILIGLSTMFGGLSNYQALKEAAASVAPSDAGN
jgi:hypothetical protein